MDSGWFDATLAWISAHPVAAGGLVAQALDIEGRPLRVHFTIGTPLL